MQGYNLKVCLFQLIVFLKKKLHIPTPCAKILVSWNSNELIATMYNIWFTIELTHLDLIEFFTSVSQLFQNQTLELTIELAVKIFHFLNIKPRGNCTQTPCLETGTWCFKMNTIETTHLPSSVIFNKDEQCHIVISEVDQIYKSQNCMAIRLFKYTCFETSRFQTGGYTAFAFWANGFINPWDILSWPFTPFYTF